jgi:hypothetical protein
MLLGKRFRKPPNSALSRFSTRRKKRCPKYRNHRMKLPGNWPRVEAGH